VAGWPADGESRAWAARLWTALAGALILWMYAEPVFVAAGMFWREFLGGFASFLVLTAALSAAVPFGAFAAARGLDAARPREVAKWASWPVAVVLAYHWAMWGIVRDLVASSPDFGFIELCNMGATAGIFGGFFGGLVFEPRRRAKWPAAPVREALAQAAAGGVLVGGAWWLLACFLDFSWRKMSGEANVYLYFTLFLMLGLPFFCAGLARDLGDARGELGGVWAVPPTILALYVVLGGSRALVDPSLADGLVGALPRIGLTLGAAAGALTGYGYRRRPNH
jgi:hypothetical protein